MEYEFGKEPFDRDASLVPAEPVDKMAYQYYELHPYEREPTTAERAELSELSEELWRAYQLQLGSRRTIDKLPHPDEVVEDMECSLCRKVCEPPVFMCTDGHLICERDLYLVPNCPFLIHPELCHKKFNSGRLLFYEMMYYNSVMQCEYKKHGCEELVRGMDKAAHEESCTFKPKIDTYRSKKKKIHPEEDSSSVPQTAPKPETEPEMGPSSASEILPKIEKQTKVDLSSESESASKIETRPEMGRGSASETTLKIKKETKVDSSSKSETLPKVTRKDETRTNKERDRKEVEQMPDFRFDEDDVYFATNKLIEKEEESKWIHNIPSVRIRHIPLEVAMRETQCLKRVLEQVQNKNN